MLRCLFLVVIVSVTLTQSTSLAQTSLQLSYNSPSGVTTETIPTSDRPILIMAQAFLDDRCPEQYIYVQGNTNNYEVKICGSRSSGLPTHYLAESKKNRSSIFLPLSSYTPSRFVARNGKYTYILDTKAQTLTIRIPRQRPRIERFTVDLP